LIKASKTRRLRRAAASLLVVLALFAFRNVSCSASNDDDFQFWSITGVSFKVDKDWTAAVEEHLKFGDDAGNLYYQHTDLGFTYYGVADWIDIGFNYKQVFIESPDDHWNRENRPHFNVTFKGRLGSLDFNDRSRFEYRDKEYDNDLWRYLNKLEVNLPFEFTRFKFRPYVADQVYINMDGSGFERNRIYAGVTFELSEEIESELYYVHQWYECLGQWQELNALGFQLKFLF
jgi:hypothetical protein